MKWENIKGKTITDIIYIKKEMSDMPYFYFDPTYILVLIGVVLSLIASAQVKSAYKKYEKVSTRSGFTAEQVAAMILRNAGITDVTIVPEKEYQNGYFTTCSYQNPEIISELDK